MRSVKYEACCVDFFMTCGLNKWKVDRSLLSSTTYPLWMTWLQQAPTNLSVFEASTQSTMAETGGRVGRKPFPRVWFSVLSKDEQDSVCKQPGLIISQAPSRTKSKPLRYIQTLLSQDQLLQSQSFSHVCSMPVWNSLPASVAEVPSSAALRRGLSKLSV